MVAAAQGVMGHHRCQHQEQGQEAWAPAAMAAGTTTPACHPWWQQQHSSSAWGAATAHHPATAPRLPWAWQHRTAALRAAAVLLLLLLSAAAASLAAQTPRAGAMQRPQTHPWASLACCCPLLTAHQVPCLGAQEGTTAACQVLAACPSLHPAHQASAWQVMGLRPRQGTHPWGAGLGLRLACLRVLAWGPLQGLGPMGCQGVAARRCSQGCLGMPLWEVCLAACWAQQTCTITPAAAACWASTNRWAVQQQEGPSP